ncbi:hypothetical protein GCM10010156_72060 [Planobispora rosea]|uniref:YdhG-like domain-containing protein n=1 Tax=Planobispora rosea TaxID=35762 RepID=A0A8J3WIE6_PLARO|nr:DUF1801 domain-containing protein [Planobispora rosea]GGT03826.1 hypothetical protein GCM10010156_72060 [Planobispora rosea]GIH88771.1 hypothetical protein Pro02_71790 [Planobispora rosea]
MTAPANPAFEHLLTRFDPHVQQLAHTARALIHQVLPGVVEVVWERQGTVGFGTGPRKRSEHFAYLDLYARHVNLGFNYGAELPDPAGLFTAPKDDCKLFRHVKLHHVNDLARPELRELITAATRHRVPPLKTHQPLTS